MMLLDLGSEDPAESGLYKSASVQIPDPLGVYSSTGSYRLPAVAVGGKCGGQLVNFRDFGQISLHCRAQTLIFERLFAPGTSHTATTIIHRGLPDDRCI
jgi:hypothetical protein